MICHAVAYLSANVLLFSYYDWHINLKLVKILPCFIDSDIPLIVQIPHGISQMVTLSEVCKWEQLKDVSLYSITYLPFICYIDYYSYNLKATHDTDNNS